MTLSLPCNWQKNSLFILVTDKKVQFDGILSFSTSYPSLSLDILAFHKFLAASANPSLIGSPQPYFWEICWIKCVMSLPWLLICFKVLANWLSKYTTESERTARLPESFTLSWWGISWSSSTLSEFSFFWRRHLYQNFGLSAPPQMGLLLFSLMGAQTW